MREGTLEYYEKHAKRIAELYEKIDFSENQNNLYSIFNGREKILEVGCGSGRDASYLYSKNLQVIATDGSKAMLREAKRAHPELKERLRFAKLPGRLPFHDNVFDGVFSIAVLMHLKKSDIAKAVEEVYRVLDKDGLFFFSISLKRNDLASNSNLDRNGRRYTLISESEWERICAETGFRKVRFTISTDSAKRKDTVWGNFLCIKNRMDV